MRYRYISDNHIHSDCSFDGADPVMKLCEHAAHLGLYSISVTDHCDCDVYYRDHFRRSIVQSVFAVQKAKAVFHGKLRVYTGIELGQPLLDPTAAREALNLGEFDFILASMHNLADGTDFYYLTYTQEMIEPLLEQYFDEVLKIVQWGRFDSLAHLTYPLRYMLAQPDLKVDLFRFQEKIDRIFEEMIKRKKALEVNTSGLRQSIGRTLPDMDLIERFRQLGGTYVTLGSDAHRWADVGAGMEKTLDALYRIGFRHYTVFSKREPLMVPIE